MRRYVVHRYGGPEVLKLEEAPEPEPRAGEVRVAARAIGINFADLAQRVGMYAAQPGLPFTPGMEAAGVIDAVGEGASAELIGKRVMAVPIYGSHAEKFCLPATRAMQFPEEMDFAEAAAFPVAFLTAHWALQELGRARRGERAVVNAAAGGVGTAILQLARLHGLRVLAVVGSDAKRAQVEALGAEAVTSYRDCAAEVKRRWGAVDIVCDSVGGRFFRPLWRLLAPNGRYVLFGFADAVKPRGVSWFRGGRGLLSMGVIPPFLLVTSNRTLAGFNLSVVPDQVPLLRDTAERMLALRREGKIRAVVGREFAFDALPDAHRHLASRASTGRVVVRV
jgi:NADPH:quinone reductase-like Zn-dependent oxidoreductase